MRGFCAAFVKYARYVRVDLSNPGTRHLSKFWAKAGKVGASPGGTLNDILHASAD
jgi:hypothetical protein